MENQKYIVGENSTGKTRAMLELARDSGAIVICKNPYSMQKKAEAYGIFGLKFLNYGEVEVDDICNEKIAIDELKDFFAYRYGAELDSFTMTVD